MTIDQQNQNPLGTILESDDDIRKAQELLRAQKNTKQQPAKIFRPTVRPPVALLTICDDGRASGEVVRIRHEQFVVGRNEGDFTLPFDELLSARHFAITRQVVKGKWRWAVTDLQSKNGVFFRVSKAPLGHGTEFLVGSGCYKYQLVQNAGHDTVDGNGAVHRAPGTRTMQPSQNPGTSILTEVVKGNIGERISLTKDHYSIGADPSCDIVRNDDKFADPFHANLNRSERGTWMIGNNQAKNGVWVRLPQIGIGIGGKCEFQAGEQRFRLGFEERPMQVVR